MADISQIVLLDGNTYDIKDATARASIPNKIDTSEKGAANGVATLDSSSKVPSSQLPSYVDDVVEYDSVDFSDWTEWVASTAYAIGDKVKITDANENVNGYICNTDNEDAEFDASKWDTAACFPSEGEKGKIYIDTTTDDSYRWSGSVYIKISSMDLSSKADKADTVLDTTLSRGRKANTTVGVGSFAFGDTVTASGYCSHAEGQQTVASEPQAHAEGYYTTASGNQSHAEGNNTTASSFQAHAEGYGTTASGAQSHAEGQNTLASGVQSHAEGMGGTYTINGTAYTSQAAGIADHAEGYQCLTDTNQYSTPGNHAEGYQTQATGGGAHSEGQQTVASNYGSHAEGFSTTASGAYSHAEGASNVSSGSASHSEGTGTTASGSHSHAEGYGTTASGDYSHAEGNYTTAVGNANHVFGMNNLQNSVRCWPEWVAGENYEVGDRVCRVVNNTYCGYICKTANSDSTFTSSKWIDRTDRKGFVEIVGNGFGNNVSYLSELGETTIGNARALDWDGNEYLKGDLYVNTRFENYWSEMTVPVGTKVATVNDIPSTMTGASASTAGASGLVPAPAAGDQMKVLSGGGTWEFMASTAVVYDLDTVTNTSGAYSHSTTISGVTSDMKAIRVELGNPSAFGDKIYITCMTGMITLACDSVSGSSTVKVTVLKQANGSGSLTSTEFDILDQRIGDLSDLTTTAKTNLVGAVNEINSGKVSKVTNGTSGNVATLDSSGGISDSGFTLGVSVPANAVFTDTTYSNATQSASGLMSDTDKTKLDGIATGATANTGDVVGPSSVTADRIAVFDGTSGKAIKDSGYTIATSVPANAVFTDTTYESKTADSGGTDVSLVTTGEKYTWNSKYDKPVTGIPSTDLASGVLPSVMTGATSSAAGTSGLVPAPATTDVDKFLAGDGTFKSGGLPMVILSYGSSTWSDFISAYNNNVIVYCRASSNSNPASGSQTRMAFMAYVNDASNPTNVEFQYYRSVNAHSSTQMGDQVFVYKLDKTSGWSVTTREASIKQIKAGTNEKIGVSWSSNVVTLSNTMTADDMPMSSSDATTTKAAIDSLNSNLAATKVKHSIDITPVSDVTIDKNESWYVDEVAVISVKGHATSEITNAKLFEMGIPTLYTYENATTFGIPVGGEWSITGIAYGYITGKEIKGTITSGTYFHILITLILNR